MSVSAAPVKPNTNERTGHSWTGLVCVGILIVVAYGSVIQGLVASWFDGNTDMGHGVLVPILSVYIVWLHRERLASIEARRNDRGLLLVALAAIQVLLATAIDARFVARLAIPIAITGVVLYLYGARFTRELAYPLALLLLMIPPPSFLYERLMFPLQLVASRMAEMGLEVLGYSVLREGNILELVGEKLSVAEACSGLRSLITVFFFCAVYVYFFVPVLWMRLTLLASVIPIALVGNALRIVLTGVVASYNRELAHGVLHEAAGHAIVIGAGIFCMFTHQMLEKLRRKEHAKPIT